MNKQTFDKIMDKANNNPVVIVGDNMILFAINVEGNYYVQDDDCVYCFRVNKSAGGLPGISQQDAPYEVVTFDYSMIQYLKVYPDTKTLLKFFEGTQPVVNGETLEQIKKDICTSPLMHACSPRGVTGDDYTVNHYGDNPGSTVVVGKDLDNFTKRAQEINNEKILNP